MQKIEISENHPTTFPIQMIPKLPVEKRGVLIIGAGEIGQSLFNVLRLYYDVSIRDIENTISDQFDILNICYPYSDKFIEITRKYINQYKPSLTIINSTVKPGTTKLLGEGVVHSPINGRHPYLEEGIKTFIKFIGGNDIYSVFRAVNFFNKAGITTQVFSNSTATEMAKILCTTYYGWNIVFMKEVARICDEIKLPFHEVYTEWNNAYNQGYIKLNENRFFRPVLYPMAGEIGGHCVIPNCGLFDDFLTQTVKGRNQLSKEPSSKRAFKTRKEKKDENISSD